jgi:hypothetical protein
MFYNRKSVLSFGAAVLAAGALSVAVPRAARAVAAALVQVTNTAANPAVAQTTDMQAAQIVNLNILVAPVSSPESPTWTQFSQVMSNGGFNPNYSVPANQTLVITAVDITPQWQTSPSQCTGASPWDYLTLSVASGYYRQAWTVSGLNTAHYSYPQGILIAGGLSPTIGNAYNSACPVTVDMQGYLTSN